MIRTKLSKMANDNILTSFSEKVPSAVHLNHFMQEILR